MNRETFKSILLAILVLASVAMTWNIWFYKADFQKYQGPSTSATTVSIAEARRLTDVVRPSLALEHTGNEVMGKDRSSEITPVYNVYLSAEFSQVVPNARQKPPLKKNGSTSYEIIFPAPLTGDTLKKVFHFDQDEEEIPKHVMVDRVELYTPGSESGLMAVFRSENGRDQFTALVGKVDTRRLNTLFSKGENRTFSKFSFNRKITYLPDEETTIRPVVLYFEKTPAESFIPVLFTDPRNVVRSRDKNAYTDWASQLETTSTILQYVNPGISGGNEAISDPIVHSFDFINKYKAWTDDFMYDGLSISNEGKQNTVDFRILLGDYMLYNTEYYPNMYLTMMELTWKSQELYHFDRTLLTLTRIDAPGEVTLESGQDILDKLRRASVSIHNIQDMAIGYRVNNPKSESIHSLKAMPDWFYKIGGQWYSATETITPPQLNQTKEQDAP
ncbi:two-component system activity regulator YycH [Sporolactobacillus sp. Y61]|jgi:regulatory protein YycH of two-component signal transduction system YycFG|uniref:Two-component system activity regulator YycH n=1 Tax=Sporolactobacillus sp. Y61 TaxID=3160863 RepID=A0AAU8II86_9BACL|nr:two-component system activity regulator YycH [Sporolactobacillus sp. THM19-2]RYL94150.1 hypothetical protein EWH91_03120 [Sporolactobacillus sp. THM19-2]